MVSNAGLALSIGISQFRASTALASQPMAWSLSRSPTYTDATLKGDG